MSVTKKPNGRWYARWRDPSGQQRAKSFDRKLDAERWLATVTVDTLTGRYVDPNAGKETVRAYAERWAAGQPWRGSTRTNRESILETHILPTFGSMPLSGVRRSDVQAWVGRLAQRGRKPGTVESYYRVLAQVMLSARRDKLIAQTPCEDITLPTAEASAVALVPLTTEEVEQLAEAVLPRYRALVLVSAGLALRQGEACGLTVDRVDFLRRKVRIDRQAVTGKSAADCAFGPVKTPASNRTIPLPQSIADVLAAHIAEYTPAGERGRLIFTSSEGRMLNRQTWHAALSTAAKAAGIEASSHDLRHHGASLLIAAGCSPKAVASFLGHKNATETLNTYAHLWPNDEERMTAAIDAAFAPAAQSDVREVCATGVVEAV